MGSAKPGPPYSRNPDAATEPFTISYAAEWMNMRTPRGSRFLWIVGVPPLRIMKSHRTAFIALLTTACGGQGDFAPRYVAIEPVASIEAPASATSALLTLIVAGFSS